jgi:serine/threonine kinase 32
MIHGEAQGFNPRITSQSKKANFDATHELEELLLEDNPLKPRKRKLDQDMSLLSAEMRQLDEQLAFFSFKLLNIVLMHNYRQIYALRL